MKSDLTMLSSNRGVRQFAWMLCSLALLTAPFAPAQARVSDRDMVALMRNLRDDAKAFQPRFDSAVKKSAIRKTNREKDAKKRVDALVRQTENLPKRFNKDRNGTKAFSTVVDTATQVDATVNSLSLGTRTSDSWQRVRLAVNQLAAAYNMPSPFGGSGSSYAAPAPPPPPMAAMSPAPAGQRHTWLRISAFATAPLANADIDVYDLKGKKIFERRNATNDMGVYPARIDHFPMDFRVTVTGDGPQMQDADLRAVGKLTLTADVRNFDTTHGVVYVNPVTTLVSRVMDRLPGHDLAAAQAKVRRLLVLPPDASLGAAMRQGPYYQSPYFSETRFFQQARQRGDFARFEDELSREAISDRARTDSFYSTRTPISSAAGYVADKLAGGAIEWGLGQGIGWGLQSSGLATQGATKADILALQNSLADLQSSVDGLSRQMEALTRIVLGKLTQTQYLQIVVPAVALSAQVNGIEEDLAFFVEGCPPLPEAADGGRTQFADYCREQKATLRSQLQEVSINSSFETLAAYMLDNKTIAFKGMLHLYSQYLGELQPFFRPADSTKMKNMLDYWYSVQVQSANLKVELMHLIGAQNNSGGVAQLKAFLGDPPKSGSMQDALSGEKKLTFPSVPVNTVIATSDRTMWAVNYPVDLTPDDGCQRKRFPEGGVEYYPIGSVPRPSVEFNGFSGWESPSLAQAQAMSKGWTGPNINEWMVKNSRALAPEIPASAGFPNVLVRDGNGCVPTAIVWLIEPGFTLFDLGGGAVHKVKSMPSAGWIFLARKLKPSEQYYWYPEQ